MKEVELTAENYKVPANELGSFHYLVEPEVNRDPRTGERVLQPELVKTPAKAFKSHVLTNLHEMGYKVTILHDPIAYADKINENERLQKEKEAEEEKARIEKEAKVIEENKAELQKEREEFEKEKEELEKQKEELEKSKKTSSEQPTKKTK